MSDSGLFPGLNKTFIDSKVTTLDQLLEISGLDFKNKGTAAQRLRIRSIHIVAQLLTKRQTVLNTTERTLLTEYCNGLCKPNPEDSFPRLFLSLNL